MEAKEVESSMLFLLAIAKEIKRSYECPVILLTQKDYVNNIYDTLISMRSAVLQHAPTETVLEIVSNFHSEWLQAIQDVERFQKRAKDTPRESVFKSIDYTVACIKNRHKYFRQYTNRVNESTSELSTNNVLLHDEMDVIKDMQETYASALLQKQGCLTLSADKIEFTGIVLDEVKELLNWLDSLYDYLAVQLCKLLELPQLPAELSETQQQVIEEVASLMSPEAWKVTAAQTLPSQSRELCTLEDNDINKITEKIEKLKNQIAQLKNKMSKTDELTLRHRAIFLEDRLESLENLKLSLSFLNKKTFVSHQDIDISNVEEDEVHMFNHLLPHQVRRRLVDRLVRLWKTAIDDSKTNSIISIMRPSESKEVFRDDLGHFTVDIYGRKLYTKKGDDQDYQVDETRMLIPVNDDEHHVYFYDECGRYYLTENQVRVYNARGSASEYMMHRNGMLLKTSETVDGVDYHYDELGRYYIDEHGDNIYGNQDSDEKYRPDGLGNLVKIQVEQYNLVACPVESMSTEDSLYLKKVVGEALKKCVTEVVMVLPQDPIQYLADRLKKYHFEMEAKKKQQLERQNLLVEREQLKSLERGSPKSEQFVVQDEFSDDKSGTAYYFFNYETLPE